MSVLDGGGLTDIHSHLVPGVDDGARTVEDTVDSVRRMRDAGITRIVTTPHLDGSLSLERDALEARLGEVRSAWAATAPSILEAFPDVDIRLGHEVMLDVPDVDVSDARMRLAGTSFVLIEWPRLQLPPSTGNVIRRLVGEGYRPIVAHPERYIGIVRSVASVMEWREAGAYLQVNYGSLVGRYGAEAKRAAFGLLRRGWVDYLSSDFHGRPERRLEKDAAWERLSAEGAGELLSILCVTNPGRILDDEPPLPTPLLPAEKSLWGRMKGMLSSETPA